MWYRDVTDKERSTHMNMTGSTEVQMRLVVPVEPDYEAAKEAYESLKPPLLTDKAGHDAWVAKHVQMIVDAALKEGE